MSLGFVAVRQRALDCGNIHRGGHEVDNCIQQLLYTFVFVGRTACYRNEVKCKRTFSDGFLDFGNRKFLAVKVFHHKLVVFFNDCFEHFRAVTIGDFNHIVGHRCDVYNISLCVAVNMRFHLDQVNNAGESVFLANRQLDRHCIGAKSGPDHIDNAIKVCSHDVHFVDMGNSGNSVTVCLTPNCLRLGLNAALRAEKCHGTVEYAQRTLNLYRKIDMSGSIDYVNPRVLACSVFILGTPVHSSSGGGDCDTSLLLLLHGIHCSSSVMNLSGFVNLSRVEKDSFRGCGLSGVYVRHDTDISRIFKRKLSGHLSNTPIFPLLPTIVRKSSVCFCHLVHVFFSSESRAGIVRCIDNLACKSLSHCSFAALSRKCYKPSEA